ncbi:50S ribosomal protein L17 [bacterium]|nr:50S ribosomal protein L17 [bacterium]
MRHLLKGRKLNRVSSHRKAMLKNMLASLIKHESIHTTDAKAKELRRIIDRVITYAKKNTDATVRQAKKLVEDKVAFRKLFTEFPKRFEDRVSGYTRILKYKNRKGDNAPISIIEFVDVVRPVPVQEKVEENTTESTIAENTEA